MTFNDIVVLTPTGSPTIGHPRALRKLGRRVTSLEFVPLIRERGLLAAQEAIAAEVAARKPDLVFVTLYGDNYQFPVEFFRRLKGLARLVFWFYDDESYFEVHSKYYAQAGDAVVTTDCFSAAGYERLGIPAATCFSLIAKPGPAPAAARDIEVSFVGDCAKRDRREFLRHLEDHGIKVETYGAGSKNGFLPAEELPAVFARSKINLNFSKLDALSWINSDDPVLNRVRGNKGRPIEIAMAGGFCLTEHYPALPRVFEIGSEVAVFCDKDTLLAQVRRYLADDAAREAMAARARRRALAEHEDETGLPVVLKRLEELLSPDRPCPAPATVYESPRFKRRRLSVLFVHLASALERGRLGHALEFLPMMFQYGPVAAVVGAWDGLARAVSLYRQRN
jgi:hypothetical protein